MVYLGGRGGEGFIYHPHFIVEINCITLSRLGIQVSFLNKNCTEHTDAVSVTTLHHTSPPQASGPSGSDFGDWVLST